MGELLGREAGNNNGPYLPHWQALGVRQEGGTLRRWRKSTLAMGRENTNLVSLFDGYDLLAIRVPCFKSVATFSAYLKDSKLSRSINAITCLVKEFIMVLNVKKYIYILNA